MRNKKFHKKYFSLLKTGFTSQLDYDDINDFRRHVLCEIGFVKVVESENGIRYYDARSLSEKECSDEVFEKVYNKTVSYFIENLAVSPQILSKVMSYE